MKPFSNSSTFSEMIKLMEKLNKIQILEKDVLADDEIAGLGKINMIAAIRQEIDITAETIVGHLKCNLGFQNSLVSFYEQDAKNHGFLRSPSFFEAKKHLEDSRASWLFVPHGISVKSVCKAIFRDTPLIDAAEINNLKQFTCEHSELTSLFVYKFESLHASIQRHLCDIYFPFIAISDYQLNNEDKHVFGFPASWSTMNNGGDLDPGVRDRIGPVAKILDKSFSTQSILSFAFDSNNWKEARIPLDALLATFMNLIDFE